MADLSEKLGLSYPYESACCNNEGCAEGIARRDREVVEAVARWLASREYLSPAAREIRERLLGDGR